MDSYQDNAIQTEKEENSIKNYWDSLQDNSSTDNLYSLEYWDIKWDTEEENLVLMKHQYSLNDLYLYGDYDNIIRSKYGE